MWGKRGRHRAACHGESNEPDRPEPCRRRGGRSVVGRHRLRPAAGGARTTPAPAASRGPGGAAAAFAAAAAAQADTAGCHGGAGGDGRSFAAVGYAADAADRSGTGFRPDHRAGSGAPGRHARRAAHARRIAAGDDLALFGRGMRSRRLFLPGPAESGDASPSLRSQEP